MYIRIDGILQLWHVQENTLPEAVVAVVKDRGKGMDRFEREMAQDGFIQREVDRHIIRFRVSVLPIVGTELKNKYESVVIRILDDRKVIKDLKQLGLVGYTNKVFVKAINQPQGMVILTGPTGSGKSTTLVAALYQVITPEVNVLTVEDPVEYVIEGARQLKIGYKMGFEQAIRSILRHDPDIVLVGEMRDKETAETAIKLANTGHLTFSTLHTNDAPSAVA
ncbi:MAG: ATPase, T2SS/T4P/T4SS family, partial [Ignavibacteriaceae bacterium]